MKERTGVTAQRDTLPSHPYQPASTYAKRKRDNVFTAVAAAERAQLRLEMGLHALDEGLEDAYQEWLDRRAAEQEDADQETAQDDQ